MKNTLKSLAKSNLISLGLTAASAADREIHKNILGSGTTTWLISNKKIEVSVNETTENKAKEQKVIFLSMLLATSGASY